MADGKKLPIFDYYEKKRTEWWDGPVDFESAQEQYRKNIEKIRQVLQWRNRRDRPLSILVAHGSGRHPVTSCAHETSNSQMLLNRGLDLAREEFPGEVEVDEFILRELMLEPCNNCASTTSALCNFPCSCFPARPLTIRITSISCGVTYATSTPASLNKASANFISSFHLWMNELSSSQYDTTRAIPD